MNNQFTIDVNRWFSLAVELNNIRNYRKAYEKKEAELIALLKELQHNQSFSHAGYVFKKIETKGSIDYSSIPELQGLDLDKYRDKPTERWLFSKDEIVL